MFIFFTINDTTGEWGRCFRLRVQKFENEESVKSRCIDPVSLDFVLSYHRHSYHYYVVADMLEYIKTHLELVMQSKEILLARRLGVETQPDPQVKEMFE